MNAVSIRPAKLADLPEVIVLLADDPLGQTRENASLPLDQRYLEAFASIQADNNQLLAVVIRKDQIVGCLQLTFIPGLSRSGMWRGQIESVRIARSARGHGLGRKMIEWAIDQCRERSCGLVQLTSDKARPEALKFYQDLGFLPSHEGMKLRL